MTTLRFYHSATLPWTESPEEERRFRIITAAVVAASLLFGLIVPVIRTPEKMVHNEEVPARFARLIIEERPPPPPLQPPVQREESVSEPAPRTEEPPQPETPRAEPVPPEPRLSVRERAARAGLLALSAELAELRADSVASSLEGRSLRQPSGVRPAEAPGERSVITSQVGSGSGGINISQLGRDTGGTQLAGRETTRVEAPVEDTPSAAARAAARAERTVSPPRSLEEIQRVFDANRGTLNTLYNRALRANPALAGKVVLKLTILPSGDIGDLEIVSSELKDADLERRLVARVRLFKFGARNVAVTTITYPIDFFPG